MAKYKFNDKIIDDCKVEGPFDDAPDFCDAYISEAVYEDGTQLTDKELDMLNNNYDLRYEIIWNWLH